MDDEMKLLDQITLSENRNGHQRRVWCLFAQLLSHHHSRLHQFFVIISLALQVYNDNNEL